MRIRDPYAVPGTYQKAQLHCHTRRSDGRFEPKDLARRYRDAGYTFICFTDHDILTRCDEVNDASFLAIPGVEETIVRGVPPLGPHLGRLLVDNVLGAGSAEERVRRTLDAGGVPCLHHPSWTGNLWTGAWPAPTMATLPGPFLVEVWNPHSDSEEDVRRWSHAARAHGPEVVISGVAADDCHTMLQFDHAWVMVKVSAITKPALREALLHGASYASTGIVAEFGVTGQVITAQSDADEMAVIDAAGTRRAVIAGGSGRYEPAGDEGFVRLECRAGPRCAWSQVFWITHEH
ncbi:MAG: PHP domain-containing protein [Armatimonadota bacterium]